MDPSRAHDAAIPRGAIVTRCFARRDTRRLDPASLAGAKNAMACNQGPATSPRSILINVRARSDRTNTRGGRWAISARSQILSQSRAGSRSVTWQALCILGGRPRRFPVGAIRMF